MGRVKTFANNGSVLPSDLNTIQDDYEKIFAQYDTLRTHRGQFNPGSVAGTYMLPVSSTSMLGIGDTTNGTLGSFSFVMDPAWMAVPGRTIKLRLLLTLHTNGTAPATTFQAGLYPVTQIAGAAANSAAMAQFGAVVAGSQPAAVASPAASSTITSLGVDFTCPASGLYGIGMVTSGGVGGSTPANSVETFQVELQRRWV